MVTGAGHRTLIFNEHNLQFLKTVARNNFGTVMTRRVYAR